MKDSCGQSVISEQNRGRIASIADGLSPSVRALVSGPMYSALAYGISEAWFHDVGYWAGRQLPRLGLATRRIVDPGFAASIPTPLGIAVRDHLRAMEGGGG